MKKSPLYAILRLHRKRQQRGFLGVAMKGGNCRGRIGKTSRLPTYLMYPRFLLETNLSDSARLVYLLLLDRARASMMNPGWEDENGRVFVFYPIEDLAADTHRSQTVVKKALADLQRQGLIRRCRQGMGKANKLFVCIPDRQSENRPSDRRNPDHQTVGIPTGNKNNQNQNNQNKRSYDYEGEDSL